MRSSDNGLPGVLDIVVGATPGANGQTLPRLAVTGELDLAGIPALEEALGGLEAARPEAIVLDLTALEFLDSSGLRCLVRANARVRESGGRLAIVMTPGGRVAQTISLTGLDDYLEVHTDLDAATAKESKSEATKAADQRG
jgi:anti-sigma B factor antagonist